MKLTSEYGRDNTARSTSDDNDYVLTSLEHAATDTSVMHELEDEALLMFAHGDSQAGCSPFLCGDNAPLVAESQAMHVAISLGDGSSVECHNNLKQIGIAFHYYDGGPSPVESDYSGAHALYQDVMMV
jgi:hypothetical protein